MKKALYIETSVVGAYLDNDDPFRRDLTIRWWEHEMLDYRVVTSILVRREIERTEEPYRTGYLNLIESFDHLELSEEVAILADAYIDRGIFHRDLVGDAMHFALASVHKIEYVATWNFGYMANVRKQARLRRFNRSAGFYSPTVVTPEFLIHTV